MPRVYVSIGSNIEREHHIRSAIAALCRRYAPLAVSTVYESAAVGFTGDNFFNLVVGFDTSESLGEVAGQLHNIEAQQARVRSGTRFDPRTLDLDLLLYGRSVAREGAVQVPRDEITRYAFVLGPLAEIAGAETHPVTGVSFAELWQAFDKKIQPMWPVDLDISCDAQAGPHIS